MDMENHKLRTITIGDTSIETNSGIHICFIYQNEEERCNFISKYLESGLNHNEKIGYFADEISESDFLKWLKSLNLNFLEKKQLQMFNTKDVYYPSGTFKPDDVLKKLIAFDEQSRIRDKFSGARITGEMLWATRAIPGCDCLIDYELKVNDVLSNRPVVALCQYDASKFDGGFIFDVINAHPYMVIKGNVVKNPTFYKLK